MPQACERRACRGACDGGRRDETTSQRPPALMERRRREAYDPRLRRPRDQGWQPGLRSIRAERVAIFDNDGTLWCEQPMQVQLFFALRPARSAGGQGPVDEGTAAVQGFSRARPEDHRQPRQAGRVRARLRHPCRHDHRRVRADRQGLVRRARSIRSSAGRSPTASTSRSSSSSAICAPTASRRSSSRAAASISSAPSPRRSMASRPSR